MCLYNIIMKMQKIEKRYWIGVVGRQIPEKKGKKYFYIEKQIFQTIW